MTTPSTVLEFYRARVAPKIGQDDVPVAVNASTYATIFLNDELYAANNDIVFSVTPADCDLVGCRVYVRGHPNDEWGDPLIEGTDFDADGSGFLAHPNLAYCTEDGPHEIGDGEQARFMAIGMAGHCGIRIDVLANGDGTAIARMSAG